MSVHELQSTAAARTFDEVTALEPGLAGEFTAKLDPHWTVGGKPNGGYMLAVLGRAATWASEEFTVVGASAHFLRAPDPGPVDITVHPLRHGRSVSHVRARLSQDGRDSVEALVTLGRLGAGQSARWSRSVSSSASEGFADCVRLHPDPRTFEVPLLNEIDVRLAPASMAWAAGHPSGRGELAGWLSLPDEAAFDPVSLLFAVDAFPPATFDIAFTGWVPTLQLSVHVRALPAPGPVRILHRAHLITGERVDESCHVWDAHGTLVAHATQLAAIRIS